MSARITPLSAAPSRYAPATFTPRMETRMAEENTFGIEANALADEVMAAAAALASPGLSATSTTSLTVGIGTISLTVQAAKSFVPGMSAKLAYTTTPTIWMHGTVISYAIASGALVMDITLTSGSGTFTSWTISLSAPITAPFESTTKMYFYQDTAPMGWTIDAAVADVCLAVKGGSQAFNVSGGNLAGTWTQPDHTLITSEIPAHSHNVYASTSAASTASLTYKGVDSNPVATSNTGGGGAHNHGGATYRPYSAVGIIATKD